MTDEPIVGRQGSAPQGATYSLDEIDAMRSAMSRIWFDLPFHGLRHYSEDAERTKSVRMEDQLRTYIAAGVPASDAIAKYAKQYDEYCADFYADKRVSAAEGPSPTPPHSTELKK
jgi:hypothetical protein